jgi:hypothetical protein
MPEPLLYLKSISAAAIVSGLFVLAMAWRRRTASSMWLNSVCVLAMGLGLALGCELLAVRWTWPPMKGLDRFLMIVMPMALGVELIAGLERIPRWAAWFLRAGLAAAIPRILLHGSVYLSGAGNQWTWWEAAAVLVICSVLLAGTWGLLLWLSRRSGGISIPLALGLTTQCAGVTVMLAGYLKGGAVAFPLATTIVVTALADKLMTMRSGTPGKLGSSAIIGVGVIGLFGMLFIGRFFGRLSTGFALVLLLIPLLCWTTELPFLRHRKPWLVGSLRLVLVAIPLAMVLAVAKQDFDRKMAPLLGDMPRANAIIITPSFFPSYGVHREH